jgi:hypothetical protein
VMAMAMEKAEQSGGALDVLDVLCQGDWSHPMIKGHTLTDPNFDCLTITKEKEWAIGGRGESLSVTKATVAARSGVVARFEYRQGPMLVFPPAIWRGTVVEGFAQGTGSEGETRPSFVLSPDVLDQQDVLTMDRHDPGYETLQRQIFTVRYDPQSKTVSVHDQTEARSLEYQPSNM